MIWDFACYAKPNGIRLRKYRSQTCFGLMVNPQYVCPILSTNSESRSVAQQIYRPVTINLTPAQIAASLFVNNCDMNNYYMNPAIDRIILKDEDDRRKWGFRSTEIILFAHVQHLEIWWPDIDTKIQRYGLVDITAALQQLAVNFPGLKTMQMFLGEWIQPVATIYANRQSVQNVLNSLFPGVSITYWGPYSQGISTLSETSDPLPTS